MTDVPRRKLIEVALPLDAINAASAREKSIRHGHPATLHLWWSRKPLATCRAVLFAQLVDDPSAHPERFPTEEEQDAERQRLFRIIEELVVWENSNNEEVLERARAEIRRSFPDGEPPPVLDPFCGGGSIPLEAQRLGLRAIARDLNPVAVLITKALIEIPQPFMDIPPVNPDARNRLAGTWRGAQGLADDVRYYGRWMRDEAERRIGHLYPKATLPDGSQATVIAWLWARTVTCPNPACRATMPLVSKWWLGKKKGKEAWVRPIPEPERKRVRFEIGHGPGGPPEGTVGRTGAVCLCCDSPVPLAHIRAEGKARRLGSQLIAVATEGSRRRVYLAPSEEHEATAYVERPPDVPAAALPDAALGFRVQGYGMTHYADLSSPRQLTALVTLSSLVEGAHDLARQHGASPEYAAALATYLGMTVSKFADMSSLICSWHSGAAHEKVRGTFARQALPMVWDVAEGNPFSSSSGNYFRCVEILADAVERLPQGPPGTVAHGDARTITATDVAISTDPPYYDNIGYADLADFFYVWLRQTVRDYQPELMSTIVTPKDAELVAAAERHAGDRNAARNAFETGFEQTFRRMHDATCDSVPITVFYAFKQAENDADGTASTGWETMLEGLLRTSFAVTGTWPLRTELGNRPRGQASNALASSIVLVCRPRHIEAGITDRTGFLAALRAELPAALRDLQKGNVAPVDLAQASIGPGMAVFSRYAKVVEASGQQMRVRTALGLINQVLDEVLAEQEGELDDDTRWAITWFEQNGFSEGAYGAAETLSKARTTSVDGLVRAGIVASRAGRVRLLTRDELDPSWDPATDVRLTVWEATHHLIRRLLDEGEESAGDLLRRLGGLGDAVRDLAYRLYRVCESRRWAKEALGYNALITSWPQIARAALTRPGQQTLEV